MMNPFRPGMRRRFAAGALIVASAAVLSGCAAGGTDGGSGGGDAGGGDKPIKIALSNYFNGNIWRKQMEASFEATAKANPDQVSEFKVVNSDGSAPQQAQQIQSLVLEGYDAIIIDAASPTALNGAIQEACDAGVTVVVFDSLATAECAYKVAFDYEAYGRAEAQFMADQLGGKGNILFVRGIAGITVDEDIYNGATEVLKDYPDMKIVGEVYGEFTESTAQQEVAKILPSLPKIDGVLTQGNDGGGTLDAFLQAGTSPVPLVIQGNSGQGLEGWVKVAQENPDYKTMSISSQPSISSTALWLSWMLINDQNDASSLPDKTVYAPLLIIPEENRDAWADALEYTEIAENPTTLEQAQDYVKAAIDGDPVLQEEPLPPSE
ncbi:monosaccharide ABC transporter substrate-binding protein (CUT2 family) [Labedella gwakjiensis]|uniref:ABC transporter substrate-binding protein n=1 Tax=Labedella gwakjiensis TaxID=390269 RepID=A0A2P8GUA1_9MICO|nr:substrate-binding domain-containing protein [Labedella gwakjiensis]PSL37540.1 monosaccharide ABC transporter substrate-binding protein (CUT2 family) [Labedella gwakjiensis]RUQ84840.1 ABC transporter substrate-binding protein [Labedella gwakjiensis]